MRHRDTGIGSYETAWTLLHKSARPCVPGRDEFADRFDRRWCEGELFGFVLERAVHSEPCPYARLVAEAAR